MCGSSLTKTITRPVIDVLYLVGCVLIGSLGFARGWHRDWNVQITKSLRCINDVDAGKKLSLSFQSSSATCSDWNRCETFVLSNNESAFFFNETLDETWIKQTRQWTCVCQWVCNQFECLGQLVFSKKWKSWKSRKVHFQVKKSRQNFFNFNWLNWWKLMTISHASPTRWDLWSKSPDPVEITFRVLKIELIKSWENLHKFAYRLEDIGQTWGKVLESWATGWRTAADRSCAGCVSRLCRAPDRRKSGPVMR